MASDPSNTISNAQSANQLIDLWAKVFAGRHLRTEGPLSVQQKTPSCAEITIEPPILVHDSSFLTALHNHYRAFLNTPLNLDEDVGEKGNTLHPTLAAVRDSLGIYVRNLRAQENVLEKSEEDTNDFHRRLLVPLCRLARVSMADCGSILAGVSADNLDESIEDIHPTVARVTARKETCSATPDHTFYNTTGGKTTNFVTIEDKNTAVGESKLKALEDLVDVGSVKKGVSDVANVWKQESQVR